MYDVIVVGARCAGSTTAMLLARKGYRVLVVDRATFPSDTMSSHHIHQSGMSILKRWGLYDRVAATNSPPLTEMTFDVGPIKLAAAPPPVDGVTDAYNVRRTVLDKLLVDAARESGAEVREGFSLTGLIEEQGKVVGIRGRTEGGAEVEERAALVVGADGMNSPVARIVGATEYEVTPPYSMNYYSYWSGMDVAVTELYVRDGLFAVVDPTNDGLTVVVVIRPHAEFEAFRADVEGNVMRTLDEISPVLGERVRAGKREERIMGTGSTRNFFRKPYGPGWALVGDAGYHRDAITAQGITDAFRDSELLTHAIDASTGGGHPIEETLALYESARNSAVMPMYRMTCDFAQLLPPPPPMQAMMGALMGQPEQRSRFFGVITGSVPVEEFYSPENMMAIMSQASAVN
jgi:2-polyprenyl-6-methoxyphenol hydroxylase-like FAD-dependent oxidoreductase